MPPKLRPIDYMEPSFASSVIDKTSVHHNIDNIIYENDRDRSFNEFIDVIQNYEIDEGRVNRVSKVSDIFNNVILRNLWEESNRPFVKFMPSDYRASFNLDPGYNIDTLKISKSKPKGDFVAELAHAWQYKRNPNESKQDWLDRRDLQSKQGYREKKEYGEDGYNIPHTIEFDAHKIIENQILDMLEKYGLSEIDSTYRKEKREDWETWPRELWPELRHYNQF